MDEFNNQNSTPNATQQPNVNPTQQPYNPQVQYTQQPVAYDPSNKAVLALVFGLISTIASLLMFTDISIPLGGLIAIVLGILAIVFGKTGRKSSKKSMGTAGMVLGIVGLAIWVIAIIYTVVIVAAFVSVLS